MSKRNAPSESAALREVRRALRWLKRAEKTLAAQERAERRAKGRVYSDAGGRIWIAP